MDGQVPSPPGGLFRTTDWVLVEDADEEIMELYMEQKNGGEGGLGYLDASKPELDLSIELVPRAEDIAEFKGRRRSSARQKPPHAITVDFKVTQDPSSLRSRAGDTGSVLWRSSLHLGRHLLSEYYFPPPSPLFDAAALGSATVLELGAGTGVLAALLAPLCGRYIATDQEDNLRLVRRNVLGNAGAVKAKGSGSAHVAEVDELDWVEVSAARERARARGTSHTLDMTPDLVLAVDCIYNEHLVRPLVDTLSVACARGAVALVVVELRSSEVTYLDTWVNDAAGWTILRLPKHAMGSWDEHAAGNWVGWVGWLKRD